MKSIRLATVWIIAVGAMFGALAASAAPMTSLGPLAGSNTSDATPVGGYNKHGFNKHGYNKHD